jgi:hypothetical protein
VITTLAFNFFLLPPFYTLTLADPQNWVALFVFLVVAVIASQLSAAARSRALEAVGRRNELARLFDFDGYAYSHRRRRNKDDEQEEEGGDRRVGHALQRPQDRHDCGNGTNASRTDDDITRSALVFHGSIVGWGGTRRKG